MQTHAAAEPTSRSSRPPIAFARRHVLLAEDDADLRAMLTEILEADGFEVTAAPDGRTMLIRLSAVSRGELPRPELILMDLRMPGRSGLELLAALTLAGWDVPVVLMTAFADDGIRTYARELGAVAVIEKPFDLDALREVLRAM